MNLRQFNGNDISLISKWLTKPHVQKYFGEPNEWLTEIQENINLDWIKYFIVEMDVPRGNNVTLESLSDIQATVKLETIFFYLYNIAAHLKTRISIEDYKQIFETHSS